MPNNNAKAVVVTGGVSGIGLAIGKSFVEAGWILFACDIQPQTEGEKRLLDAGMSSRAIHYRQCDVRDKNQVDSFYTDVEQALSSAPTCVVNNAGIQTWSPLLDLSEADWDRVIATNLKGTFLHTQSAARAMHRHSIAGSIINLGSGCNQVAFPRLVDYAASKGGIEMLTKVAAVELGELGIRVNCVAPGGILNERTANEAPDYEGAWSAITPLGRVGRPSDVASAVLFLAGDESSYISGHTLFVDGGTFAKANWPY